MLAQSRAFQCIVNESSINLLRSNYRERSFMNIFVGKCRLCSYLKLLFIAYNTAVVLVSATFYLSRLWSYTGKVNIKSM